MQSNQRTEFYTMWATMMELQAGQALSDRALRLAFDLLAKKYELFEIERALEVHCLKSQYHAKPSNIVAIIEGEIPSNAELYGLAQAADTMLGVYVLQAVGAHDIKRLTARDATSRVASIRRSVEAFIERVQAGMMYDNEIRMLGGKEFDVTTQLCPNLPGARIIYHERLRARQAGLVSVQIGSAQTKATDAPAGPRSEAETQKGQQMLAEALGTLRRESSRVPA